MTDHYDTRETRDPAERETDLFARLPSILRKAMEAPAYAERLRGVDPAAITNRAGLAQLPVLRKSELPALHKAAPPFGGFAATPLGSFARLFTSPGPIFEPETARADPWRSARALFAAGFRPGDVVLNTFSYHLTPGGFIFDSSARALRCAVIPAGPGNAETQFELIEAYRPIGGKQVNVDSNDYGYQVPRAIALYKKWSAPDNKVAAIMGWGTADTEALTGFLAQDKIPDMSGSYAAALTDPEGTSGKAKPAPYNFFYGPTYSDALRAMLMWAAEDWKAKGKPGKPKFVHMGANHPYPNAPKAAGEALATELGFEVLPPLVFALSPGDYSAQCLSLKSSGANYAYLGNTAASNISVMKACKAAGVDVQFLGNVWGMDENGAKTAGDAADGVVFPLRTAVAWGGDAPGMKTVLEISKMSDPSGKAYRPVHYVAGVCSAMYMKEALDWAAKNGGATGENVAKAFYQRKDWVPAGMEGVCNPSTWTDKDHRGTMKVDLYRAKVSGPTDGDINDLMAKGTIKLEKVKTVELPRKPDWFGW